MKTILIFWGLIMATAVLIGMSKAAPAEIYSFQNEAGTLVFTDDPEQIPEKYQATMQTRAWEQVRDITEDKITVDQSKAEVPSEWLLRLRQRELERRQMVNPNRSRECTFPVTIKHERRQIDDRDRDFFVAYDECGDQIYESQAPIYPLIRR